MTPLQPTTALAGTSAEPTALKTPEPIIDPVPKSGVEQVALLVFIVVPFLALLAAIPVA